MTSEIALLLLQDGVTNGAIYALIALALVLVYTITRVLFVPQGELMTFGALTLAAIQQNAFPKAIWLLLVLGIAVAVLEAVRGLRMKSWQSMPRVVGQFVLFPLALWALCSNLNLGTLALPLQMALTVAIVVAFGPVIYRLAFASIAAKASVLSLLIVAVAVHFVLVGLGLVIFGPEGVRTKAISDAQFAFGSVMVSAQSIWVVCGSVVMIVALFLFFGRTLLGKALRATAVNRQGARLVGIRTATAGESCFALAALIGAISGILISPITTIYYDSGFLIGLKGVVAAIIGALTSYPAAAMAALLVGLMEAYSSFWASAFKEVILFTLVLPFLIWRSLRTVHVEEEE
jgi:branched-chain amino acid transport system permease protein